ncbi:MAG TPA: lysophospholipid acyltransferase family protein [Verrucomicrobiae bacterium]|nr:lysophospholipid acyltransferase family protein [Verrucomicrobiae bacterium]
MTTRPSLPHKRLMGVAPKEPWWYGLIRSRLFESGYELVLRGLFRLRLRGIESLPHGRPLVFCYNHGSHYDLFFMLAVGRRVLGEIPVPVTWQGTMEYPLIGSWLRAWRVVTIGRTSQRAARSQALWQIMIHLREGRSVIIACEGKRLDALGPFQPGAAWAAMETGALIVPCSLRGVQPLFKNIPRPDRLSGRVEVHFHPPLDPRSFSSVEELTSAIRRAVASQIDYPLQENAPSAKVVGKDAVCH